MFCPVSGPGGHTVIPVPPTSSWKFRAGILWLFIITFIYFFKGIGSPHYMNASWASSSIIWIQFRVQDQYGNFWDWQIEFHAFKGHFRQMSVCPSGWLVVSLVLRGNTEFKGGSGTGPDIVMVMIFIYICLFIMHSHTSWSLKSAASFLLRRWLNLAWAADSEPICFILPSERLLGLKRGRWRASRMKEKLYWLFYWQ